MIRTSSILYLSIILILFTALRNISIVYYLSIFLLLGFLIFSSKNPIFFINNKINLSLALYFIFFIFTFFVIFWSWIYWESFEFIGGIHRVLLMLLLVWIMLSHIKNEKEFETILKILLFCYFIAALTIIYQIYFGSIPWFAKQAGRAGMFRYSSILGSLTIFGSVVGYAYLMTNSKIVTQKSILKKLIYNLVFFLTVIFSLSKGAVVIFFSAILIYLALYSKSLTSQIIYNKKYLYSLIILIFTFLLIFRIDFIAHYYNSSITHVFGTNSFLSNSSGVIIDSPQVSMATISKRLFYWVNGMLEMYGPISYISGVGLQGAGGTLGLNNHPMAHNAFGDLLFMGGLIYLSIFLLLFFSLQTFLWKNRFNAISKLLFAMNCIFFINMTFASGTIFHPAISFPFWLSLVYVNMKKFNQISFIKK